jgi:hypothetical protein
VTVTINPDPVPYSGQPITDVSGCRNLPHTWFYEQILEETAGVAVTFNNREDFFDGRSVNKTAAANIAVPAKGKITIKSRWCSSQGVSHTAQTNFGGTDAKGNTIAINGPVARLQSP